MSSERAQSGGPITDRPDPPPRRPTSLLGPSNINPESNSNLRGSLLGAPLVIPGPPSAASSPCRNPCLNAPSATAEGNRFRYYTNNLTPNSASSFILNWSRSSSSATNEQLTSSSQYNSSCQQQTSYTSSATDQSTTHPLLRICQPPPELSISPADSLSKPSSSENLSSHSPNIPSNIVSSDVNDTIFSAAITSNSVSSSINASTGISADVNRPERIATGSLLQELGSTSPTQNFRVNHLHHSYHHVNHHSLANGNLHSPSSLSVNYVPSPLRDRSNSACCTSSFVFPPSSGSAFGTNANIGANNNQLNTSCSNLSEKMLGSATSLHGSMTSSMNELNAEMDKLEKAIRNDEWKRVRKMLLHFLPHRTLSGLRDNLKESQSKEPQQPAGIATNRQSARATLYERLSMGSPAANTAISNWTAYRAQSAFERISLCSVNDQPRRESADSAQRVDSPPLFQSALHLAVEANAIDCLTILLKAGFGANESGCPPCTSLDIWRRKSDSSHESHLQPHIGHNQNYGGSSNSLAVTGHRSSFGGSREALISTSPNLLSPIQITSYGSPQLLSGPPSHYARTRQSLTSEPSSLASEYSSIGRYSTPPRIIKLNNDLPDHLRTVCGAVRGEIIARGTKQSSPPTLKRKGERNSNSTAMTELSHELSQMGGDLKPSDISAKKKQRKNKRIATMKSTDRFCDLISCCECCSCSSAMKLGGLTANVGGQLQLPALSRSDSRRKSSNSHLPSPFQQADLSTIGSGAISSTTISGGCGGKLILPELDAQQLQECCVKALLYQRQCCQLAAATLRYHCHCGWIPSLYSNENNADPSRTSKPDQSEKRIKRMVLKCDENTKSEFRLVYNSSDEDLYSQESTDEENSESELEETCDSQHPSSRLQSTSNKTFDAAADSNELSAHEQNSFNEHLSYEDYYSRDLLYTLPPLFLATASGNSLIARQLIRYGANVNVVDMLGCTPLHLLLCQQRLNRSLLRLLLANGAKLSLRNNRQIAPVDLLPGRAAQLVQLQRKMIVAAFAGLLTGADGVGSGNGPVDAGIADISEPVATERTVQTDNTRTVRSESVAGGFAESHNSTGLASEYPLHRSGSPPVSGGTYVNAGTASEAHSYFQTTNSLDPTNALSETSRVGFASIGSQQSDDMESSAGGVGKHDSVHSSCAALNQTPNQSATTTSLTKSTKTANFLRKLKASAMSRSGRARAAGLTPNTLAVAAVNVSASSPENFLCLEEISSDGPSHGSNRFMESTSINDRDESVEEVPEPDEPTTIATTTNVVNEDQQKKELGKEQIRKTSLPRNFIEPSAPNSGPNYIINLIKGSGTTRANFSSLTSGGQTSGTNSTHIGATNATPSGVHTVFAQQARSASVKGGENRSSTVYTSSSSQLEGTFLRNAEAGLQVLVNMAGNVECFSYIVQLFQVNLTSIVAVLDRAGSERLDQLVATLFDKLLFTIITEAEHALNHRTSLAQTAIKKERPVNVTNSNVEPVPCGQQSGAISCNLPILGRILCVHERSVLCSDLNALLKLCIGCMRGGQSLQFTALLQLNKIMDVMSVYSLMDHRPFKATCSSKCSSHGPRCCKQRAELAAMEAANAAAAAAASKQKTDANENNTGIDGSNDLHATSTASSPAIQRKRSPSAWNLLFGGQTQLLANRWRSRFRRRTGSMSEKSATGVGTNGSGGASSSFGAGSSADKSSSIERVEEIKKRNNGQLKKTRRFHARNAFVESCSCRRTHSFTLSDQLSDQAVSLLLNVLNNAITMNKRCAYPKPLCTPSNRWRQCTYHCLQILSARSLLFLIQSKDTRKKLIEEPSLRILISSLESSFDPQVITLTLQIMSCLALDLSNHSALMATDLTDYLMQLVLPSDERFYTNHSTKYPKYVKHHAARILVYLGFEKMLKNKVYLFDLLEETLNQCTNAASASNSAQTATAAQQGEKSNPNAGSGGNSQANSEPLNCGEEDTYICRICMPPVCVFQKPQRGLVAASVEAVVLELLQQIELRINFGETEDEILEMLHEGVDRLLFEKPVSNPSAQTALNEAQLAQVSNQLQKMQTTSESSDTTVAQPQAQSSLDSCNQQVISASTPQPPPAIQVDFIGSARSSPRKSLPTSTSVDTAGTIIGACGYAEKDGQPLNACSGLSQTGLLPGCAHVQRLYLRTFPVCVSPLIVLRLLQHRLFGCLNSYWHWQHAGNSAGANGLISGYPAAGGAGGGYNSRSSFASTCGVESFQGSRSRASSATANSLILPPEFESIVSLRSRRNVSLTINCPLNYSVNSLNQMTSLGNLTSVGGRANVEEANRRCSVKSMMEESNLFTSRNHGMQSQRLSINYQPGSGSGSSGVFTGCPLTAANSNPQEDILEFQRELQNIPRTEYSPVANRNFLVAGAPASSFSGSSSLTAASAGLSNTAGSGMPFINDMLQRRATTTATGSQLTLDSSSGRPRSCSMPPQQQQQQILQQQQSNQHSQAILQQQLPLPVGNASGGSLTARDHLSSWNEQAQPLQYSQQQHSATASHVQQQRSASIGGGSGELPAPFLNASAAVQPRHSMQATLSNVPTNCGHNAASVLSVNQLGSNNLLSFGAGIGGNFAASSSLNSTATRYSLRSTSGGDAYSLSNAHLYATFRCYMPTAHKAIFLLLHQWHQISALDFNSHSQFRKELNEFLNKAAQLGEPYSEKVNQLRRLFALPERHVSEEDQSEENQINEEYLTLKQLILSGNLLCSKEDAARLAGIQLRIQETAPIHPATSGLGSAVGSTATTVQRATGVSVTVSSASGSTTGLITGQGSALNLTTTGSNQMAAPSGSSERNTTLGAKLRPICEDAKELSPVESMNVIKTIGQMRSYDKYLLDEDDDEEEDDEDDDEDEDDDDDDDEEDDDEDDDEDEEVDDDELNEVELEDLEDEVHSSQLMLHSTASGQQQQTERRRPKLMHTKRAKKRQSRSSSVISDQLTTSYTMSTPQSLLGDSRPNSRIAGTISGRASANSIDMRSGAVFSSKSSVRVSPSPTTIENELSTVVGTSSPAGKAKHFTKQLGRQLSKQLLRLNSSSKLPVSSALTSAVASEPANQGSTSTIKSSSSAMSQNQIILNNEELLKAKKRAQGRFASFSGASRGSIGWLVDRVSSRSGSRGELRDLERITALGNFGPAAGNGSNVAGVNVQHKQRNLISKVRKTSAAVRHWMSSSLGKTDNYNDMINLRECVPPMYYNTKGMAKCIKEQKRKLFHSQFYESDMQLKRLYIQTCRRLPAYGCELFEVKEVLRTRTSRRRVTRILALGMSRILLLDAATFALSRSQPTGDLSEWRTGAGNGADRILLEFRGCRWSLLATSATSMQSISNSLWTLMKSSTQSASAFLAQLLQVDPRLFQLADSPELQPQLSVGLTVNTSTSVGNTMGTGIGSTIGDNSFGNVSSATYSTAYPMMMISSANSGRLAGAGGSSFSLPRIHYRSELELLQTMLHFPEEVALRLADVDHELFYSVQPVDFLRHITCSLSTASTPTGSCNVINQLQSDAKSNIQATVHDLIRRFNEVSSWVTHLIISQPSHEDRKAILSCLIRVAQAAWNMGAFNTALEVIAGLKCDKLRPFWLCMKENDASPTLEQLCSWLLFTQQPSNAYRSAVQRALQMNQSKLVPFFGGFLKDLHAVFSCMPSLIAIAQPTCSQNCMQPHTMNSSVGAQKPASRAASISGTTNFPISTSADNSNTSSVVCTSRHLLAFVSDYQGESHFLSRIGIGGLVNVQKMQAADQVLNNLAAFHDHWATRLELFGLNDDAYPGTNAEGNILKNVFGNTFASRCNTRPTTCGSMKANPPSVDRNNNNPILDSFADPYSHESNPDFLQQHPLQQPHKTQMSTDSQIYLSNSALAPLTPLDHLEPEFLYEILHPQYQPIQSPAGQHSISFVPLQESLDWNALQLLQHGCTCVHVEEETGRAAIVYLQLEAANSTLAWCKPSWSALKKQHGYNFAFGIMTNNSATGGTGTNSIGATLANSSVSGTVGSTSASNTLPGSGVAGGAAASNLHHPTTSAGPATDFNLSADLQSNNLPQVLQRYATDSNVSSATGAAANALAVNNGLEEGYLDLWQVKQLTSGPSGGGQLDLTALCKRIGLCAIEFTDRQPLACIGFVFGGQLSDNRRTLFVFTSHVGRRFVSGLASVYEKLMIQRQLADQRINWLKLKYLQLYYENGRCRGPSAAQAIRVFGGRKWATEHYALGHFGAISGVGSASGVMASALAAVTIGAGGASSISGAAGGGISGGIGPSSGRGNDDSRNHSGSAQSSLDLSTKRASTFGIAAAKLRKKKSSSSLSTLVKENSPRSRASSGEDPMAFGNISTIGSGNAPPGTNLIDLNNSLDQRRIKKERFRASFFYRKTPLVRSAVGALLEGRRDTFDSQESKTGKDVKQNCKTKDQPKSTPRSQSTTVQDSSTSKTSILPKVASAGNMIATGKSDSGQSFSSNDSTPTIYTSQLTAHYRTGIHRQWSVGCRLLNEKPVDYRREPNWRSMGDEPSSHTAEFTTSNPNAGQTVGQSLTGGNSYSWWSLGRRPRTQPPLTSPDAYGEMSFIQFVQLFRAFSVRSRKDIRELFDKLSSKSGSTCLMKEHSPSSSFAQTADTTTNVTTPASVGVHTNSVSPAPQVDVNATNSLGASSNPLENTAAIGTTFQTKANIGVESLNDITQKDFVDKVDKLDNFTEARPPLPSASMATTMSMSATATPDKPETKFVSADKISCDKKQNEQKSQDRILINPNQPLIGVISRNSISADLSKPEQQKQLQVFDAIATASIVHNCAGLECSSRVTGQMRSEGSGTQMCGSTATNLDNMDHSTQSNQGTSQLSSNYLSASYFTCEQFAAFLKTYQGEMLTMNQVHTLIQRHEPQTPLRERNCLSFEGFTCYLLDKDNYAFTPEVLRVNEAEMDYPLSHYYIATSHNTYLTGHQLKGESSVDLYAQVLLAGCRCVELDCHDGDDGSPVIYHGRTLTSKISFRRVVETINQYAFQRSPYPVILSIENHCSMQQQVKMAQIFLEVFGEKLVTKFMFEQDFTDHPTLPSPNQLQHRILIKNKKLRAVYAPNPYAYAGSYFTSPMLPQHLPQQLLTATMTSSVASNLQGNVSGVVVTAANSTFVNYSSGTPMSRHKGGLNKGFTQNRTNSLISAASTGSLNEEEYEEDDDEETTAIPNIPSQQLTSVDHQIRSESPCLADLNSSAAFSASGSFRPRGDSRITLQAGDEQIPNLPTISHANYQLMSNQLPLHALQTGPYAYQVSGYSSTMKTSSTTPSTTYHPKVVRKSSSQVAPELSDLVTYCQAIKFRGLGDLPAANSSPTNLPGYSGQMNTGVGGSAIAFGSAANIRKINSKRTGNVLSPLASSNFVHTGSTLNTLVSNGSVLSCENLAGLASENTVQQTSSNTGEFLSGNGSPLLSRPHDNASASNATTSAQQQQQQQQQMITQSMVYPGFRQPNVSAACYQVASINEHSAKKLSRKQAPQLIQYNLNNLLRIYPSAKRFDSSNFDPLIYWASGIQMVALNYQTEDAYFAVNQALFELTALCGFVLKPEVLRSPAHVMYDRFNPWDKEFDGLYAIDLSVLVISGQHVLPDSASGSTLVEVELLGIPVDCAKIRTKIVQRNSLNPIWNEMFEFRINFVDLAFVRFAVIDANSNHVCAQRVVPLRALRPGYRHLRLHNPTNHPLSIGSLFLYTCSQEEGLDSSGPMSSCCPTDCHLPFHNHPSQQNLNLLNTNLVTSGHTADGDSLNEPNATIEECASGLGSILNLSGGTTTASGVITTTSSVISHTTLGLGVSTTAGSIGVGGGSGTRKKIFLLVHNVLPDGKPAILKVSKDTTTSEVVQQALIKQQTASGGLSSNNDAVGTVSQANLSDYVLIEELGSDLNTSNISGATMPMRTQRILELNDHPAELQQAWPTTTVGRFILMRISNDPSSRAWYNTIKQRSKAVAASSSLTTNQPMVRPASAAAAIDSGSKQSTVSISQLESGSSVATLNMLKGSESFKKLSESSTVFVDEATNAMNVSNNGQTATGPVVSFRQKEITEKPFFNKSAIKNATSPSANTNLEPSLDTSSTFTICILNVSTDLPYTILRCPLSCSSLDVIRICLHKAHLTSQAEPGDFCLLQELVMADHDLNSFGTAGGSGISGGVTSSGGFLGGSSSAVTLDSLDKSSSAELGNRRVLSDKQNVFEQFSAAQICWLGRVQFRMMRKRDVCLLPNVLLPDDFTLPLSLETVTDHTETSLSSASNRYGCTDNESQLRPSTAGGWSKPSSPDSAMFSRRLNKLTKSARGSLRKLNRLGKMSNSLRSKRFSGDAGTVGGSNVGNELSCTSGSGYAGGSSGRLSADAAATMSDSARDSLDSGGAIERESRDFADFGEGSDGASDSPTATKKRHQSFAGVPATKNMMKLKQMSLSRFRLWK